MHTVRSAWHSTRCRPALSWFIVCYWLGLARSIRQHVNNLCPLRVTDPTSDTRGWWFARHHWLLIKLLIAGSNGIFLKALIVQARRRDVIQIFIHQIFIFVVFDFVFILVGVVDVRRRCLPQTNVDVC